jgi:hypothetical protein
LSPASASQQSAAIPRIQFRASGHPQHQLCGKPNPTSILH